MDNYSIFSKIYLLRKKINAKIFIRIGNYIMDNDKLIYIINRIKEIYHNTNIIRVSLNQKRKKINTVEAKITGIYNNFITVTSFVNNYEESFTITYIDLMIGRINIDEL